jgi:ABC-2 type transport system permease protein
MQKTLVVFRRELLNLIGKPAFWISMIVVPVVIGALVLVVALTSVGAAAGAAATRDRESKIVGVIDNAGLLQNQPAVLAADPNLRVFANDSEARAALDTSEIKGFFVIDPAFVANGRLRYIANEFNPLDERDRVRDFEKSLQLALLAGDQARAERFSNPAEIGRPIDLAPDTSANALPFSPVPIIVAVMFMGSLLGSSSYLMQSVATEKENRVMEVLLSSISPTQLLTGKILGLGSVGFLQLAIWMISTFSALPALQNVPQLQKYLGVITPESMLWATLFFVLGYFIYAALMAGLGAIVPTMKDASSLSFIIMLPLLAPIYLNSIITDKPDGALAVILSLIPFCTPVAMPMRMLSTSVPFWQPLLAAVLMLATAWFTLKIIARIFSAQALLRGSKVPFREVLRLALHGADPARAGARA